MAKLVLVARIGTDVIRVRRLDDNSAEVSIRTAPGVDPDPIINDFPSVGEALRHLGEAMILIPDSLADMR